MRISSYLRSNNLIAFLAQLVEHAVRKRTVVGSIPTGGLQYHGGLFPISWCDSCGSLVFFGDRRSQPTLMSRSRRPDRTDRPTRPTDRSQTKTFVFCMFSFPVSKHRRCVHVYFVLGTTGRNMCLSQPNERREKGARGKRVLANPLHNLHQQVAKTRVRSVRIELTTLGL